MVGKDDTGDKAISSAIALRFHPASVIEPNDNNRSGNNIGKVRIGKTR